MTLRARARMMTIKALDVHRMGVAVGTASKSLWIRVARARKLTPMQRTSYWWTMMGSHCPRKHLHPCHTPIDRTC